MTSRDIVDLLEYKTKLPNPKLREPPKKQTDEFWDLAIARARGFQENTVPCQEMAQSVQTLGLSRPFTPCLPSEHVRRKCWVCHRQIDFGANSCKGCKSSQSASAFAVKEIRAARKLQNSPK